MGPTDDIHQQMHELDQVVQEQQQHLEQLHQKVAQLSRHSDRILELYHTIAPLFTVSNPPKWFCGETRSGSSDSRSL